MRLKEVNPEEFYARVLPNTGSAVMALDIKTRTAIAFGPIVAGPLGRLVAMIERSHSTTASGVYVHTAVTTDTVRGYVKKCEWDGRCVAIDVDTKSNGGKSDKDLIKILAQWFTKDGMQPTHFVVSGGGIHAYWVFDSTLSSAQHRRLHKRAKAVEGVEVDASPGAKVYSMMRAVGSINRKHGTDFLVRAFETGVPDLKPAEYLLASEDSTNAFAGVLISNNNEDLAASEDEAGVGGLDLPESYTKPLPFKYLRQACAEVDNILVHGIHTCTNDQWMPAIALLRYIENGRKVAHACSARDSARYNASRIDNIFDDASYGPPTCETINPSRDGRCAECVAAKGSKPAGTPITAALRLREDIGGSVTAKSDVRPSVVDKGKGLGSVIPANDCTRHVVQWQAPFLEDNGRILIEFKDPDGNKEIAIVTTTPWHLLGKTTAQAENTVFLIFLVGGDIMYVRGQSIGGNDASFSSSLANVGIYISTVPKVRKLVQTALIKMIPRVPFLPVSGALGAASLRRHSATTTLSEVAFLLPDGMHFSDGSITPIISPPGVYAQAGGMQSKMSSKGVSRIGTARDWLDHVSKALAGGARNDVIQRLMVLTSIGAPMAGMLGIANSEGTSLLCIIGPSGCGKTAAQKFAMSVWGAPIAAQASGRDTVNYINEAMSAVGHLPIVLEELTTLTPEAVHDLLLHCTSPASKGRLNANGTMRETKHWSNTGLASSNTSLLSMSETNNTALSERVLEVYMSPLKKTADQKAEHARAEGRLASTHGEIGRELVMDLIGQNKAWLLERVAEAVTRINTKHSKVGRFAMRMLTVLDVAYAWLNERYPGQKLISVGDMEEFDSIITGANADGVSAVVSGITSVDDFLAALGSNLLVLDPTAVDGTAINSSYKTWGYTDGDVICVPAAGFLNMFKSAGLGSKSVGLTCLAHWTANGTLVKGVTAKQQVPIEGDKVILRNIPRTRLKNKIVPVGNRYAMQSVQTYCLISGRGNDA